MSGSSKSRRARLDRRHLRERRVLHHHDRPIRRLAAMAVDDLTHAGFVDAERRGEQAHRAVQILGVLAHDRDAVGAAVLDQHLQVAVEHDAARRRAARASADGCSPPSPRTCACSTTCSTQNPTASTVKMPMMAYCRIERRVVARRRSSAMTVHFTGSSAQSGLSGATPFHRSR